MTTAEPTGRRGFAALDPCVHCGFCLPACPTYLATGDENDSPRGRIVMMRALEAGELPATDPSLRHHLEACLGCRGCEPVCPSGVGYGHALESARSDLAAANGLPWRVRAILTVFRHELLWRPLMTLARWFRATGLPGRLAGWGPVGFGMGMVAGTEKVPGFGSRVSAVPRAARQPEPPKPDPRHPIPTRLAVFRGCVMDTLFRDVNDQTRQILQACGYDVVEVPGQGCCGALHAHAGAREAARAMAERNIAAFDAVDADYIVVNSAGCGALLREYPLLVGGPRAEALARKVRDITEILADSAPPYARVQDLNIVYDPPCHLQHAQRIHEAPLAVLRSIPGVRVQVLPGADRCCGGAGLYGLLHPELSRQILAEKLEALRQASPPPDLLVTGNPGCLMQLGAGLRAAGMAIPVAHPVEVVGWGIGVRGEK